MADVSGFGTLIEIRASFTFPAGFTLTQFADDADPIDIPSLQIGDKTMGANGDLITWSKANPIPVNVNILPGDEDDSNMMILFDANRISRGKNGARDIITMTIVYPDSRVVTFNKGKATDYIPGNPFQSSGRLKTKPYSFAFESVNGAPT
jgi:hypothetical protein